MKSQINNLASQRLVWLDALKGIGILLIMACHAGLLPRVSIFLTARVCFNLFCSFWIYI